MRAPAAESGAALAARLPLAEWRAQEGRPRLADAHLHGDEWRSRAGLRRSCSCRKFQPASLYYTSSPWTCILLGLRTQLFGLDDI
jgi:hypothetical protein